MQIRPIFIYTAIALCFAFNGCTRRHEHRPSAEIIAQDDRFTMFRHTDAGRQWFSVRTTAAACSGRFIIEVTLDRKLVIQDSRIVSYPLSHGRGILQPGFWEQFKTKSRASPIRVGHDIQAVTGATSSSMGAADAVRDALAFASRHIEPIAL